MTRSDLVREILAALWQVDGGRWDSVPREQMESLTRLKPGQCHQRH